MITTVEYSQCMQILCLRLYIKINVTGSEGMIERRGKNHDQSCLPEKSTILCGCAISTLDAVCDSIVSGCITVNELENIAKKIDQMEKLCSAAKSANLDKKGEEYDKFMMALTSRLTEYRAFINRRNLLGNLCKGVTINVTGECLTTSTIKVTSIKFHRVMLLGYICIYR